MQRGLHAHKHCRLQRFQTKHMQVRFAHKLTHKVRSAQPLSDTFASLAPISSHFSFSVSSSFSPSLLHSAPPPSAASLYRSILFIVNTTVPMATSELLIAKVLHIESCNHHRRCASPCVCLCVPALIPAVSLHSICNCSFDDESSCSVITCGQTIQKTFRVRRVVVCHKTTN